MNKKELAENYIKVWNAGEEHLLHEFAATDLEVFYTHFGITYHGIADYKKMLQMTHDFFPDMQIKVRELMLADKQVTIRWGYSGTHKNGKLFGVEASGKKVQVEGITILEIKNGKVNKESGIVDNLSLAMQLGALA